MMRPSDAAIVEKACGREGRQVHDLPKVELSSIIRESKRCASMFGVVKKLN